MRDVAIIGAGMVKFGRYPEKSISRIGAEAVLAALKDASVSLRDVQLLAAGNFLLPSSLVGQHILYWIGQTGIPVVNVTNLCASGSTAFREAYIGVASGMHDLTVAVGVEQMGKAGIIPPTATDEICNKMGLEYDVEGVAGPSTTPGVFSLLGVEHMRKYGTTFAQFAKVAVKNHHHSTLNPYAQYQVETPLETVMNARMIAYPNTLYMCSPTGDGAGAVVLAPWDQARRYTSKPVRVAASILTCIPWSSNDPLYPLAWDVNTVTRLAAQQAYEQAGLGAEDLDLVELHDCFATAELLHYENLGLCGEGEAGRFIDEGHTYIGGRIPVNASGGLLSKGHPLGATGVANIVEVAWQLRGEAGARQVEGAKVGLAHVIGLGSACTINILQS
ncbi:MAG TPA: thiolase family protein [Dehalococcoidia bacterium]|nr:thiolase family protein [Dehalococcoidia bacterium]